MQKQPNISGINYDRPTHPVYHRGMLVRFVAVVLTLIAMGIVVFLLFNPVKPRPSVAEYIQRFNEMGASQDVLDRLPAEPVDPAVGSVRYPLPAASMTLDLVYDQTGYMTGMLLSDDRSRPVSNGWQALSPLAFRKQVMLVVYAADPKSTMVELYQTFDRISIDLDQPLHVQPAGTREANLDGLILTLTHDADHFSLSVRMDVLEE